MDVHTRDFVTVFLLLVNERSELNVIFELVNFFVRVHNYFMIYAVKVVKLFIRHNSGNHVFVTRIDCCNEPWIILLKLKMDSYEFFDIFFSKA